MNEGRPRQREFHVLPCTQCKRRIRVPLALLGGPLKCPGCGGPLEDAPVPVPSIPAPEDAGDDPDIIQDVEVVQDVEVIPFVDERSEEPAAATRHHPAQPKKRPATSKRPKPTGKELQHISREGWSSLGIGALLAIFIMFFPCLNFIFSPLLTIVHELGHAAAGWLCGFPSVPTIDFQYGGGVTYQQHRSTLILLCVFLLYSYLFIYFRRNRLTLLVLLISLACYSALTFTYLHEIFIVVMGHGSELIFSGIFLYRAMSGYAVLVPLERPLYGFAGFFIQFYDMRFAIQLLLKPEYRTAYEDAKGGGHWMDFSRLAEEFFHVRLPVVALFFLCACLLPPLLSFLFFRYQPRILRICARLLKAQ
jgi:hypothetical protein